MAEKSHCLIATINDFDRFLLSYF